MLVVNDHFIQDDESFEKNDVSNNVDYCKFNPIGECSCWSEYGRDFLEPTKSSVPEV